jgi:hypothetical protein
MDGIKTLFASKTIWTNIITALAGVLAIWGFNLTPEQQAGVVTAVITIGPLLSSIFRYTATDQLVASVDGDKAGVIRMNKVNRL